MDVKQAVARAKEYIADLFRDEGVTDLGLEEVDFDDKTNIWYVTIGFTRPWEKLGGVLATMAREITQPIRSYKVVRIDDRTEKVLSVKNRESKS